MGRLPLQVREARTPGKPARHRERIDSVTPVIRRKLPLALALCAIGLAGCSSLDAGGEATAARIVSGDAIASVNAFRAEHNEPALAVDPRASQAALAQARNMAVHQVMEHNIGIGASFAGRMKSDGVPLPAAENIASGQQSVAAAVDAWEKSPPHRRNMLGKDYRGVGVAVATDAKTGRPYWSMVLTGG